MVQSIKYLVKTGSLLYLLYNSTVFIKTRNRIINGYMLNKNTSLLSFIPKSHLLRKSLFHGRGQSHTKKDTDDFLTLFIHENHESQIRPYTEKIIYSRLMEGIVIIAINSLSFANTRMQYMLLISVLSLSAFTHLWNPIGFPSFYVDEGHYIRRSLQTLDGLGFQESNETFERPYDHPYFGQIFLAFIFKIIGYPDSLNPKPGDVHSVEMLYLVPRVLMGLLAVVDTFLVYKIADRLYGRKVAFIASIFFAVMPMTWMLRRIYLDSILLPFLLSSIFFALYYAKRPTAMISNRKTNFETNDDDNNNNNGYKQIPAVVLSGIFLGLAIFTKIPVFTMIPLVAYLIYKNSNLIDRKGKLKTLGLWFIPVILIPAMWPAYNMLYGHFDDWQGAILWQTTGRPEKPLFDAINIVLQIDPVLLILATAGIGYSIAIRKGLIFLLWIVPFLIFLGPIGFVSFFHFIPLIPLFCIAAAGLVVGVSNRFVADYKTSDEVRTMDAYINSKAKNQTTEFLQLDGSKRKNLNINAGAKSLYSNFSPYGITLAIGTFGLVCTTMLITTTISSAPFQATAFVAQYIVSSDRSINNNNNDSSEKIVVVSNPIFSWMLENVFKLNHTYLSPGEAIANDIDEAIIVVDSGFRRLMEEDGSDFSLDSPFEILYNRAKVIVSYEEGSPANSYRGYPYTSMRQNFWSDSVEIKTTY
jgi:hypothetical protein